MEKYGIIYMYKNEINGKVYIGQTTQPIYLRRREHWSGAFKKKTNMPFHKALTKYGKESFTEIVLCSCFDKESLDTMEQYFINFFKSSAPFGYNIKSGGSFGKHSDETRAKISARQSGAKHPMSPTAIKGLREKWGKPVIATNSDTGEILKFESMAEAEEYGFSQPHITGCCKGYRNIHKGYTWRYA